MSYWEEIDTVVESLRFRKVPLMVMQCTSRYPCAPEDLGLNLIPEFIRRYKVPVGFSDHSGEVAPGLAAVTLGATAIEVHITWHKKSFGPDVGASLTIEQFTDLAKGVRILEAALAAPVDKDRSAHGLEDMRKLFTKGLVAADRIDAHTRIERQHLDARKPCVGIPASEYETVLGKIAVRAIEKGSHIRAEDLA
jgi:N-acetylneuraminate synthase